MAAIALIALSSCTDKKITHKPLTRFTIVKSGDTLIGCVVKTIKNKD